MLDHGFGVSVGGTGAVDQVLITTNIAAAFPSGRGVRCSYHVKNTSSTGLDLYFGTGSGARFHLMSLAPSPQLLPAGDAMGFDIDLINTTGSQIAQAVVFKPAISNGGILCMNGGILNDSGNTGGGTYSFGVLLGGSNTLPSGQSVVVDWVVTAI